MPASTPTNASLTIPAAIITQTGARPRLDSIDLLRGLVMVIMALDHARDFFTNAKFDPTALAQTSAAYFLTRWITHFCAPTFVFLAGTAAFLFGHRGRTKSEVSWFLLTRGLWLVVLELTVVRFGWSFNWDYHNAGGATIWALGWSMVALAGLVYLPVSAVTIFGVAMIALHNLFDPVRPEQFGALGWLWKILHSGGPMQLAPGYTFVAAYPLAPWIGVMAAGYGFGTLMLREPAPRRKWILSLGIGLCLAFVAIRATNLYGDANRWSVQKNSLFTLFSFLNCVKYPPSLLYLCMTLGPALVALALFDRGLGKLGKPLIIFGRVPLFYYVLHLLLIHATAVVFAYVRYGRAQWLMENPFVFQNRPELMPPPDNGYGLPVVYLVWIGVVVALYPVCRWFAGVKQRHKDAWLSYL